jgi:tripartite-type tricarboxylate transporter receptor subunit TctC
MKIHAWYLACLVAFACASDAYAAQRKAPENYPSKPIRFIVPFVPGGATDIQERMLGEKLGLVKATGIKAAAGG